MAKYELSSESPVDMDVLAECFSNNSATLQEAGVPFELTRSGGGLLGGGVGMVAAILTTVEGIHALSALKEVLLAYFARRPGARITIRVSKRKIVVTSEGASPESLAVLFSELKEWC